LVLSSVAVHEIAIDRFDWAIFRAGLRAIDDEEVLVDEVPDDFGA
jgi:hypothetical protein